MRAGRRAAFGAACLSLLALAVAGSATEAVVAQSGGISLRAADVQALIAQADPDARKRLQQNPQALAELVRGRLIRMLLLDEAKAAKWDQKPDIARRAAEARDAVIVDTYLGSLSAADASYPAEADIQAAYESNKSRFVTPRQYRLAQIFIAVPADAPRDAEDSAQRKLRDMRQQLLKPQADFAEFARRESQDRNSAAKGGELGWLGEDQLVPAAREVVAGLPENGVGEPLRMNDGWHLLKLLETKRSTVAPLADVRESIVRGLRQQRAAQNAQAYLASLLQKRPVQINEIELAHAVQP